MATDAEKWSDSAGRRISRGRRMGPLLPDRTRLCACREPCGLPRLLDRSQSTVPSMPSMRNSRAAGDLGNGPHQTRSLLRQLRTGDLLAESSDPVSGVPQAENPCQLIETLWKAGCLEILHVRFGVGAQVRSLGLHHSSSEVSQRLIAWRCCSRSWQTQNDITLSHLRMCVISWCRCHLCAPNGGSIFRISQRERRPQPKNGGPSEH